jgi:hypothetical protein
LPFFDEANAIAQFSPTKRRRGFANHGDKLLSYLEQYIDVLDKWTTLGNMYIKLAEK